MIRTATTSHPIHHLLLAAQIKDLMTGHHMIVTSSLKWPTSYSAEIKCLLGTSTSSSACWLCLLLPTAINHHFWRLQICTMWLIPLLLAMLPGNPSACSITEPDPWKMFHLEWKWSTMSGFGIPALWCITSCLIPISNQILIMCCFKSTQLMEFIASKTSCLEIWVGNKWHVFTMVI